jgi:hypothetical protein
MRVLKDETTYGAEIEVVTLVSGYYQWDPTAQKKQSSPYLWQSG